MDAAPSPVAASSAVKIKKKPRSKSTSWFYTVSDDDLATPKTNFHLTSFKSSGKLSSSAESQLLFVRFMFALFPSKETNQNASLQTL